MLITKATMELFDQIVDTSLLIRRVNIAANHVIAEDSVPKEEYAEQFGLVY